MKADFANADKKLWVTSCKHTICGEQVSSWEIRWFALCTLHKQNAIHGTYERDTCWRCRQPMCSMITALLSSGLLEDATAAKIPRWYLLDHNNESTCSAANRNEEIKALNSEKRWVLFQGALESKLASHTCAQRHTHKRINTHTCTHDKTNKQTHTHT